MNGAERWSLTLVLSGLKMAIHKIPVFREQENSNVEGTIGSLNWMMMRASGSTPVALLSMSVSLTKSCAAADGSKSIAACVIGGAILGGGGGTVLGTFGGVLTLGLIDNLLNLFNVQSYYQQIFKGLIILVAVLARRKD